MLLVELTHTSHTLAATGIQQVCRNLFFELGKVAQVDAVIYDKWQCSWRTASPSEREMLTPRGAEGVARRKGESWTMAEKARGRVKLLTGVKGPLPKVLDGVLFPEFISEKCVEALPDLRRRLPKVPLTAVFHDAIALRFPELSAPKTVERFPRYISVLTQFDAIAAVSEASRVELLGLWAKMGIRDVPQVTTIPLGISRPKSAPVTTLEHGDIPRVLCVGTLEPRKNHLALFDAAEILWDEGVSFNVELVGMAHRELGAKIVERIRELERAGRDISWLGAVDNDTLSARYAACDFTVYPSLMEGFGLPVLESLSVGKPCVCTTCGGLDEVSQGGGCVRLAGTDAAAIAFGLRDMLKNADLRERLTAEAVSRPLRTWSDYALDMLAWTQEVRLRNPAK